MLHAGRNDLTINPTSHCTEKSITKPRPKLSISVMAPCTVHHISLGRSLDASMQMQCYLSDNNLVLEYAEISGQMLLRKRESRLSYKIKVSVVPIFGDPLK